MKTIKIGDIFTNQELEAAKKLYQQVSDAGTHDFATRCAKEIITPILPRINAKTGQENDAKYFAYMLEYLLAVRPLPLP